MMRLRSFRSPLAILLLVLMAPVAAWGAISATGTPTAAVMSTGSPYNVAFTMGAGGNGYIVFVASDGNHSGQTIGTITWNAISFALLCTQDDPGGGHVEMWGAKVGSTTGTADIVVTYSAQARAALAEATAYSGVSQTTSVGSCVQDGLVSSTESLTISLGGGEWAVAAFEAGGTQTATIISGTERISTSAGGTLQQTQIADNTSSVVSYGLLVSGEWAGVGVALKPDGGGGGGTIRHRAIQNHIAPPWRYLLQRMFR